MTRDHFERMHYYGLFVTAAINAGKALKSFENMKDFYDKGFVSKERVREAEERYLVAKEESDRLSALSLGAPQPDPNPRWQP